MSSRTLFTRSLRQVLSLIAFVTLVSGCFQTAGAQLEATVTPPGGAQIAQQPTLPPIPTTAVPPPTAITPVLASPSPAQTQLVFSQPTDTLGPPTDTPVATDTPIATDTAVPTETPIPTNTLLPSVMPSATVPSVTPSPLPTKTPSPVPTEPPIITPTRTPAAVAQVSTPTSAFNGDSATQTQNALFAQATNILDTVTAAAAQQQTTVATLQGTNVPPQSTGQQPEGATSAPPPSGGGGVFITFTPTPLPAINNAPVSGAMGNITNNCLSTVVDGDRLFRIALRFGLATVDVANANRLINPDLVVPGEVIRIPNCAPLPTAVVPPTQTPGGPTATTGASSAAVPSSAPRTYMVIDGDTLYSIATRFGVRVIALAQANGITNLNLIYIGQSLTIPADP